MPGGRGEKAGLREGFEVLEVDGQTLRELVHEDAASLIWSNWVNHRKIKLLIRVHSNATLSYEYVHNNNTHSPISAYSLASFPIRSTNILKEINTF